MGEAALTRDDIGVWLINLDRATERREKMVAQLEKLGLDYTLFSAVDGRIEADALMDTVDVPEFSKNHGRPILPGEVGCYHSHLRVWKDFLASDKRAALILEDDVVFHGDFLESLDVALAGSAHWDTIRFNSIRAKLPVMQGRLGRYRLNAYVGPFTGTAGYLIQRKIAARLLPGLLPMTRAFDHELNRFFVHNYRQMGLEPFSSHVDDGSVSTITGADFGDVKKFRKLRRLPYYRLKTANYFRRAFWLARQGMLWPRRAK